MAVEHLTLHGRLVFIGCISGAKNGSSWHHYADKVEQNRLRASAELPPSPQRICVLVSCCHISSVLRACLASIQMLDTGKLYQRCGWSKWLARWTTYTPARMRSSWCAIRRVCAYRRQRGSSSASRHAKEHTQALRITPATYTHRDVHVLFSRPLCCLSPPSMYETPSCTFAFPRSPLPPLLSFCDSLATLTLVHAILFGSSSVPPPCLLVLLAMMAHGLPVSLVAIRFAGWLLFPCRLYPPFS